MIARPGRAPRRGAGAPYAAGLLAGALAAAAPDAEAGERPDGFVDAAALVPGLVVDLRYAGPRNFVGRAVDGYEAPRCLLTTQAAAALGRVQDDLRRGGLGLKVFDCYRPRRAVADFARWARDASDTRTKAEYYPEVEKGDLFRLGYIAARSSHSRGSAIDLTLVGAGGREVDMGTPFDFFGPASATAWPGLTAEQRANRRRLGQAMAARGFRGYAREWWHYTLQDEPYPRTSFDFPVR